MLLVQTSGSVKIGEIVRYTITYTPSLDRIFPLPDYLHLRIKNTASLPLRAAYLHGPYTVYVSVRRQEFRPYKTWESEIEGDELEVPQYEPNLKAGASFYTLLKVPDKLRDDALNLVVREENSSGCKRSLEPSVRNETDGNPSPEAENGKKSAEPRSVTWIIEVISQTIFSAKATVGFELLLGRDEKSVSYGLGFGSSSFPSFKSPAMNNFEKSPNENDTGTEGGGGENQKSGVLSPSVKLKVQDTADLWNLPPFPSWSDEKTESFFPEDEEDSKGQEAPDPDELDERENRRKKDEAARRRKRVTKKVHLVIITHGLHSNTGADMLFMKEAIDDEARRQEEAYQKNNAAKNKVDGGLFDGCSASHPYTAKEEDVNGDDREMIIVRGYHGNVCSTEKGIKWLGKRLAKYVISLVNPGQPNPHPLQQPKPRTPNKLRKQSYHPHLTPAARNQSYNTPKPHQQPRPETPPQPPYKVTSISFIGHSLGGLVQTYAIAFIHAHHPEFFSKTKPVNFVALASPFLGLSNENPMYVKFALDFGLVGRTGQDLGLTWRAPNMAASALNAIANHAPFANSRDTAAGGGGKADITKPLLRILPTGPAHEVLKMFRNRTVYANVVNDGIVPLRTSCLLYLDWKGLGKVEKARRENQVVGLVGWGWQQLTTGNSGPVPRLHNVVNTKEEAVPTTSILTSPSRTGRSYKSTLEKDQQAVSKGEQETNLAGATIAEGSDDRVMSEPQEAQTSASIVPNPLIPGVPVAGGNTVNPFSSLMTIFRPQAGKKPSQDKIPKIYHRSQISQSASPALSPPEFPSSPTELSRAASPANLHDIPSIQQAFEDPPSLVTSYDDFDNPIIAPPRTTILEAAGDVLNPPLPTVEFIINPGSRPKTIWHDRVYHSEDIPLPPLKERPKTMLGRRPGNGSGDSYDSNGFMGNGDGPLRQTTTSTDGSGNISGSSAPPTKQQTQLKVEEKIARAYHKDLSWRKVLVRLEPDAHNNIVVRRMFANAYGWPVVRHLVDTHFGDTLEAKTADVEEGRGSRPAVNTYQNFSETVCPEITQMKKLAQPILSPSAEMPTIGLNSKERRPTSSTEDSGRWSDAAFSTSDDDDSDEVGLQPQGSGDNTPTEGTGNRNGWAASLCIKWPLGALGTSNTGGEEIAIGTSEEQTNTLLKSDNQSNHAAAPVAAISKIDAWAHGSNNGENPHRSGGGSSRPSIEERGNYLLGDATKVGLGTGNSSAIRELGKFKRSDIDESRRGSTSTITPKGNDEGDDEGFAERVARLGFRK
ncbi:putative serine esterase-domain-containing protein [Tirmania nivea]|nr:putative serine esterase-domain-containing protein [Tirmania nivea]